MEKSLFVGRRAELDQIKSLILKSKQGQGSVIFLRGEAGEGKSQLLETLQDEITQTEGLEQARFVYGYCDESIGAQTAYQPLIEILDALTKTDHVKKDIRNLALSILKEVGPDLIQMIPGLGLIANAGIKTVTVAGQLLNSREDNQNDTSSLSAQYVNSIIQISTKCKPLVLIIEDTHWIDQSSCSVLGRLARLTGKNPLTIVLTYRDSYLSETHPLKHTQAEICIRGSAQMITLDGLTENQVEQYIKGHFGCPIDPHLAAWLTYQCSGNPFFVAQYLSLLEQQEIIRAEGEIFILEGEIDRAEGEWKLSKNIPIPATIEIVLEQRIQRLMETDRKMLQHAAIQGEHFMSTVLSQLLAVNEIDLLPRLRVIVEQHRLIRYGTGIDDEITGDSETYSFEHALTHRIFYERLSRRERVLYHRQMAKVLEQSLNNQTTPPRKLVIEVAHHYDLGGVPQLASKYYWSAAHSSFIDSAFSEAANLCKKTLVKLRQLQKSDGRDNQLYAEVIRLLLVASEINWRSKTKEEQSLPLEDLIREAESAAAQTEDLELKAHVRYLNGFIKINIRNLREGLEIIKEAAELAQQGDNPLTQFIILSQLGHQTAGESLSKALTILTQANDLYETSLKHNPPSGIDPAVIAREYYLLQSRLGIGQFDLGNYGEAMKWLKRSVSGLEQLKIHDYLPGAYNFLAQVLIATGLFEDAEEYLSKAIELLKDSQEPSGWNGYNNALLGKLYMEWNRSQDAVSPLEKGWAETQETMLAPFTPLVRNYCAELLMQTNHSINDYTKAHDLLRETINETENTGFHRSAIDALSKLGQLECQQGQIDTAVEYSSKAVQYLERKNNVMPALQTEEVFFHHFRILTAAGQAKDAEHYLELANKVIENKASTIKIEEHRRLFMEKISLNRDIASAMSKLV